MVQNFTPINEFFTLIPDSLAEARVLSMALGMQALRAHTQGNEPYSQCILAKLVTPKDANTPADGFTDLFNQMESHKTVTIPLEKILAAAARKDCGAEPSASTKAAQ
ncbi:hypothetical protein [Mesorhizobium sophorae]|uniref:hypothetical protein n=1 Tax=Mesorhizobium sophorae TaxID=1300294 RepID=UPI000BA43718|nr:hypothetical protein [Mesorhizobium sophorae]